MKQLFILIVVCFLYSCGNRSDLNSNEIISNESFIMYPTAVNLKVLHPISSARISIDAFRKTLIQ